MQLIAKLYSSFVFFLCLAIALGFALVYSLYILHKNALPQDTFIGSRGEENATTENATVPHSLETIKSNQWYSSLYTSFPSQPLYAMPSAYRVSQNGLGFSLPKVKKTENTIFATYDEDFSIGLKTPMTKSAIHKVGDWNVGVTLTNSRSESLKFTLAHGVPYTIITTNANTLLFKTKGTFMYYMSSTSDKMSNGNVRLQSFLLKANNTYYAIAFDKRIVVKLSDTEIEVPSVRNVFVGSLDTPGHFKDFLLSSGAEIQNTYASYTIENAHLITDYMLDVKNGTPLIALYPHQYDLLSQKPTILGEYETLRGKMHLTRVKTFETSMPLITPPLTFPSLEGDTQEIKGQLKKDISGFVKEKVPDSKDYYLGIWFGRANTLLLLSETMQMNAEKDSLLSYLQPILKQSLSYFSYDKKQTSLIAKKPEFGNEKLNDHHFHYGYYIQTAAILSRLDPTFLSEVKPEIDAMVADIATTDRASKTYPYLRNFDVYEGHSWADGYANFVDGNNQESSSEAINAWYGLYLWSELTNNTNLRTHALAMYLTEIQSAKYYWFDVKNMYTAPYEHKIATIVWGGKVDFATWFSNEANMKYGIELLPFTPGSSYLGTLPNFEKYKDDYLTKDTYTKEWGNYLAMWEAMYSPENIEVEKYTILKAKNSALIPSLFLYWVQLYK